MPFGLSGASQSFQRFIDTVLRNITITLPNGQVEEVSVLAYIDDILLARTKTMPYICLSCMQYSGVSLISASL